MSDVAGGLSAAAFAALALTATVAAPVSAQEKTVMVGGAAMFPSKNIIQNAVNSKDHTTLVAAVKAAGLVETLKGKGPFTVFAPVNAAFAALPAGTVDTLLKPDLIEHVIEPILPKDLYDQRRLEHDRDFVYCNPTGKFVIGGPMGDTGLTGRKIIVDTYGGAAPHGGGAFSGKDPTKVDRSAAYAARYVAKNVVAAGLADRCQVQVAYAIGVAHPMSVLVDTFATEADGLSNERISELVSEHFDLRPGAIVRDLDLRRPIYRKTAAYGHFGRTDSADYTWERTDKVDALRAAAGLAAPARV